MMKKVYIDIPKGWNELNTAADVQKQDIKFVRLLLLIGVGLANLARGQIYPAVQQFIYGIFHSLT